LFSLLPSPSGRLHFFFQPMYYYNTCSDLFFFLSVLRTHARNKCCFCSLSVVVVSNLWHRWQCHLQITSVSEVIGGTGGNVSENDEVAFQGFSSDQ
jgi:hypothetical protein